MSDKEDEPMIVLGRCVYHRSFIRRHPNPEVVPNDQETPNKLKIFNVVAENTYWLTACIHTATCEENVTKDNRMLLIKSTSEGTIDIDTPDSVIKHYTIRLEDVEYTGKIFYFQRDF